MKKKAKKFGHIKKKQYLCTRFRKERAFSSAGLEHLPYKQRVGGSNPSTPTTISRNQNLVAIFFIYICLKSALSKFKCNFCC